MNPQQQTSREEDRGATEPQESVLAGLGRQIQRRRSALHMSLGDVARQAGCSRQNVHKVERARSNPTLGTLQRIASALGMRLSIRLVPLHGASPDPRTRLLRRFQCILDDLPDHRLDLLAQQLGDWEERLGARDPAEEERRTRELERLLRMARVPPEIARRRARTEPAKPADWTGQRERLHGIIKECRQEAGQGSP